MKLLIKFIFRSFQWFCIADCFLFSAAAQPLYPRNYFSSPLQIPLKLVGNFGEIRTNHFHSGLDFKTDSVIGKIVMAAADGYVSRIKISATGFGKVLYITHPNGYTTVYAHLHHFADSLNMYAEREQYKKETFEIELFPDSNTFRVKKGALIGWSGNTGASAGPHLHFEIRDSKTEKPINPLLFGFDVRDTLAPLVKTILFNPVTDPVMKKRFPGVKIRLSEKSNLLQDTIQLSGMYGFEFMGYDLANGLPNRLGIYSITLTINDSVYYRFKQTSFAFDETRYANAHIDFEQKLESDEIYERCYRLPGDLFSLNQMNHPSVFFDVKPGSILNVLLEVSDIHNNLTRKKMIVKGILPSEIKNATKSNALQKDKNSGKSVLSYHLKWDQPEVVRAKSIALSIPKGALYEDVIIKYIEDPQNRLNAYQELYYQFEKTTPLHLFSTLTIRKSGFPEHLKDKALIAQVTDNNILLPLGGSFKKDSISAKIRSLGTFTIVADTSPPTISNYQIKHDGLFNTDLLSVRIKDDLSGIASYRATINGKWILMEYDEKTGTLFYTFRKKETIANKEFIVVVTDKTGNSSVKKSAIRF